MPLLSIQSGTWPFPFPQCSGWARGREKRHCPVSCVPCPSLSAVRAVGGGDPPLLKPRASRLHHHRRAGGGAREGARSLTPPRQARGCLSSWVRPRCSLHPLLPAGCCFPGPPAGQLRRSSQRCSTTPTAHGHRSTSQFRIGRRRRLPSRGGLSQRLRGDPEGQRGSPLWFAVAPTAGRLFPSCGRPEAKVPPRAGKACAQSRPSRLQPPQCPVAEGRCSRGSSTLAQTSSSSPGRLRWRGCSLRHWRCSLCLV